MRGFEGIIYIIAFWVAMWLIGIFWSWLDDHKTKIRDQVLIDFQKETDLQAEIREQNKTLEEIKNEIKEKYFKEKKENIIGEFQNYIKVCPSCKKGRLVERYGKYGNFYGCSNYPTCRHTDNVEDIKYNYKTAVRNKILSDIQKAYS